MSEPENLTAQKMWLTAKDIQDELQLGPTKVYELLADGTLPSVKIGRIYRVARKDLEIWAERNRQPQQLRLFGSD